MIPADILGQFSTVIWIGNYRNGDLGKWQQTSIMPYVKAGGNVLLMSRLGQSFIYGELQEYLGIAWAEDPFASLRNCVAVYPGLQTNIVLANQSLNSVFETDFSVLESTLLFQETVSFAVPRGLGVWRQPAADSDAGHFVFLSGRPYRYGAELLSGNIEFILQNLFQETAGLLPDKIMLFQNYPNPFNESTKIGYQIPNNGRVKLEIYNILGQKIETLFSDFQSANSYEITWDTTRKNTQLASGIYILQLSLVAENFLYYKKHTKMLFLK
jgi:hypothetical protein